MSKKANKDKLDFVNIYLSIADHDSRSKETAKEFLESEGINTEKLVSEGMNRIKKMQMLVNAKKTELAMHDSEVVRSKAAEWVDKLLSSVDFSLSELIEREELTMSFRNIESLNKNELRSALISHFILKFMNNQNHEKK